MVDYILTWNDIDGESHGEEFFTNKEKAKERIQELKDEYSFDEIEWELKEGKKCPCCNSIVSNEIKFKKVV
jgi:hypothetical protein